MESIQPDPNRTHYVDSLVEKYIIPGPDNSASVTDREEVSSTFVKFLGHFGDAWSIKKAGDRHAKLFLCHGSSTQLGKRPAQASLVSDKTKLAKSYAGPLSYAA